MKFHPVCALVLASFTCIANGQSDNAEEKQDLRLLLKPSSSTIESKPETKTETKKEDDRGFFVDGGTQKPRNRLLGVSLGNGACASGNNACTEAGLHGNFTAGNSACLGDEACYSAARNDTGTFSVGDDACDGFQACLSAGTAGEFLAGTESCDDDRACAFAGESGSFAAGDKSCRSPNSCEFLGYTTRSIVKIGVKSCINKNACSLNRDLDTDRSITIGNDSCNCIGCCRNLMDGSFIGDGQCNSKDENCNNQETPVIKTPMPSTSPSDTPSLVPSVAPSSAPSDKPSQAPSTSVAPTSFPSGRPSQVPSDLPSLLPTLASSNTPSTEPSPEPSNAPTSVTSSSPSEFVQHLTFDETQNLLGLTDSDVTVSLAHLANDDENELQDLVFNEETNELSLTNSTTVVDLSHLMNPPQDLNFDNETMILGMTDSPVEVDLSVLRQDLSLNGNSLDISAGGSSVDLSAFRVIALQASIDDIDGDDTSTEYIRGRKLPGDDLPKVRYGGNAEMGWLLSKGRLVGMTIAANSALKEGLLKVSIVDCTDVNQVFTIGEESLTLGAGLARKNATKFATPIPVEAGIILCFQAVRIGNIDSDEKDNAANVVVMLEQW